MTQYFRKVKCSERLPNKQGMYMTNNGVYHFNIRKNEWAIISQTYIVWWFEPVEEHLEIPNKGADLINFLLTNALIHLNDEERMTLYQSIGDRVGKKVYTHLDMSACWDAALSHALKLKGYYKTFQRFIKSLKK